MTAFNEWIKEPLTADRFERAAHLLISHMATEHAVTVTKDDLKADGLSQVRLATLTDEGINLAVAAAELLATNQEVNEQAKTRKLAAAIREKDLSAAHLDSLNPAQKMNLGRKLKAEDDRRDAVAKSDARKNENDDSMAMKLAAIMQIKSPAARLELARSWGLA